MSDSNLADIIEDTLAPKLISLDLFYKDLEDNDEILKLMQIHGKMFLYLMDLKMIFLVSMIQQSYGKVHLGPL